MDMDINSCLFALKVSSTEKNLSMLLHTSLNICDWKRVNPRGEPIVTLFLNQYNFDLLKTFINFIIRNLHHKQKHYRSKLTKVYTSLKWYKYNKHLEQKLWSLAVNFTFTPLNIFLSTCSLPKMKNGRIRTKK